jgi:hypothetical protein
MPTCSICRHRDRDAIDALLAKDEPLRRVEKKFTGVSRASLGRHRAHLPAELVAESAAAVNAELAPLTGSLKEQIQVVLSDMRRIVSKAERSGHLQVASGGLKSLASTLELLGKLTGEIRPDTQIAIGVNVSTERGKLIGSTTEALRWGIARHVDMLTGFSPEGIENLRLLAGANCPECRRFGCQHDGGM